MAAGRIIAVVLLHAFFATVWSASVNLRSLARTHARMRAASSSNDFREVFSPPTMLIVSSPMERKVSYAQIKNFKSVGNTVLPILDAGLVDPYGVAWDAPRSALYICDAAQKKIFRLTLKAFKCLRQCKGLDIQLQIDGDICTVVEGVISQWVSVDETGNLFFTDQESNAVNKLPAEAIELMVKEKLLPKDLKKTTEPEMEGEEAVKESISETLLAAAEDDNATKTTPSTTPQPPSIFQLYAKGVSDNVGTPAGIAASGEELYWTNQQGGFTAGAAVKGKTDPRVKALNAIEQGEESGSGNATDTSKAADSEEKPTFPSSMITNITGSAYGICLTSSKLVFTDSSHNVWASSRGTGETVTLSAGLLKPRGVVWDGDNTVYIADQEGNSINSMPVGLLKAGAPIAHTLDIHSPFGIALISSKDPIWDPFETAYSGARRAANAHSSVMLFVKAALVLLLGSRAVLV